MDMYDTSKIHDVLLCVDYLSLPIDTPDDCRGFIYRAYCGRDCPPEGPEQIIWGVLYNQASKGVDHSLPLLRFLHKHYSKDSYTLDIYLYLLAQCEYLDNRQHSACSKENVYDSTQNKFLEEFVLCPDHLRYIPRILERHSPGQLALLRQLLLHGHYHVLRQQTRCTHVSQGLFVWAQKHLDTHMLKRVASKLQIEM